jgi:hypothetical protein
MKTQFLTLKEVKLHNNCPECFSNEGLHLRFKQKFVQNALYKSVTSDIQNEMQCHTCNTGISPGSWTREIDQVVAYQERAIKPKPKSIKLTKLAWIIVILDAVLIFGVLLFAFGVFS